VHPPFLCTLHFHPHYYFARGCRRHSIASLLSRPAQSAHSQSPPHPPSFLAPSSSPWTPPFPGPVFQTTKDLGGPIHSFDLRYLHYRKIEDHKPAYRAKRALPYQTVRLYHTNLQLDVHNAIRTLSLSPFALASNSIPDGFTPQDDHLLLLPHLHEIFRSRRALLPTLCSSSTQPIIRASADIPIVVIFGRHLRRRSHRFSFCWCIYIAGNLGRGCCRHYPADHRS